jgi:hypothetical protein
MEHSKKTKRYSKKTKMYSKKTKRYSKKTKRYSKKTKRYYGGNDWKSCPKSQDPCDFSDTQHPPKINKLWETCINENGVNNHILYITPLNNLLIKDIETMRVPLFQINKNICKIQIEDKFVNCFLNICDKWYAIMRLFGKTLNTGVFARTETNKAFYELKFINVDKETGSIEIKNFEVLKKKLLFSNNTPIIKLNNDTFTNIRKDNDVFKILQKFRQQKIVGNAIKENLLIDLLQFNT